MCLTIRGGRAVFDSAKPENDWRRNVTGEGIHASPSPRCRSRSRPHANNTHTQWLPMHGVFVHWTRCDAALTSNRRRQHCCKSTSVSCNAVCLMLALVRILFVGIEGESTAPAAPEDRLLNKFHVAWLAACAIVHAGCVRVSGAPSKTPMLVMQASAPTQRIFRSTLVASSTVCALAPATHLLE